jgi:hypothetical protein
MVPSQRISQPEHQEDAGRSQEELEGWGEPGGMGPREPKPGLVKFAHWGEGPGSWEGMVPC